MKQPHLTTRGFFENVRYAANEGHAWWYLRLTPYPPDQQDGSPSSYLDGEYVYCNLRISQSRTIARTGWEGLEILWKEVQRVGKERDQELYYLKADVIDRGKFWRGGQQ